MVCAEHQFDHRGKRRTVLHGKPGIGNNRLKIILMIVRGQREIPRAANRGIKRLTRAVF